MGTGLLGSHLTQCGGDEAYLQAKFHLDPSNRSATIHQRHRQTDRQDRQTDNGPIAQGELFYKQSPKSYKILPLKFSKFSNKILIARAI